MGPRISNQTNGTSSCDSPPVRIEPTICRMKNRLEIRFQPLNHLVVIDSFVLPKGFSFSFFEKGDERLK